MNETGRRWLHPWIRIDLELRPLLAERIERGATGELDRRPAALIEERRGLECEGWFS